MTSSEQIDCASILQKSKKKCFHHATTAKRLPDIIASGGLLSPERLGEKSDRWGANPEFGKDLVCCGFRPPWYIFKYFRGEESVILSFDAPALAALPRAIFSPHNTATRDATEFLQRSSTEQPAALVECLESRSWRNPPEFLAPKVPLSALQYAIFCDQEAKDAWSPVITEAMGKTVPLNVGILVNGELDQIRFPPDFEVKSRIRPVPDGIDRRGGSSIPDSPVRVDPTTTPEEISNDFWIDHESEETPDLFDTLFGDPASMGYRLEGDFPDWAIGDDERVEKRDPWDPTEGQSFWS
ncbi:MAG: hypothetical protein IPK93_07470 [Solirubrobacterales bacterium]|nr:hypothetical protein [Solirubrobacterales bacterium]